MTGQKVRILCPGGHGIGALTWSGHGWELDLTSALLKPHPIWPKDGRPTHTDLRQIPPLDLARLTEDEPPPPAASQAYVGLRHTWLLDYLPDLFETGCPRCQLNLLLEIVSL